MCCPHSFGKWKGGQPIEAGGGSCDERTTEVLEQYELEVQSKRRGRGAWICETSQGLKLLREYKGTVKRLEFEEQI